MDFCHTITRPSGTKTAELVIQDTVYDDFDEGV